MVWQGPRVRAKFKVIVNSLAKIQKQTRSNMFLILLSILLTATHATTSCDNELFSKPASWGAASGSWFSNWAGSGLPLATAPVAPDSKKMIASNTCSAYAKAKNVCCSDATLAQIATTVTAAKSAIAAAVKVIKDEKGFADSIVALVAPAISTLCPSSGSLLPGDTCKKLTATVTQFTQQIIADATRMASDQQKCADALISYAGGLACMACDVDFAKFVDVDNKVLKLSENTCTHVYDACVQPIQNDVHTLFQTVNTFVAALLKDIAGIPDLIPPVPLPDMCGGTQKSPGDCKHYICYEMLDGLASSAWLDWTNIFNTFETSQRRRVSDGSRSAEEVMDLFQKHLISFPRRLHDSLVQGSSSSNAHQTIEAAAPASHSTYTDGGYDPYAVGCQDTKTCDGFPWVALVVCVAVAMGLVGLVFIIKARGSKRRNGTGYTGISSTTSSTETAKPADSGYGSLA